MKNLIAKFVKDERGLVVVATIVAIETLGGWVQTQFDTTNTDLAAHSR